MDLPWRGLLLKGAMLTLLLLPLVTCRVGRPTVTQLVPEPPLFMVAHPLRYDTPDGRHSIVVPVGFVSDLASIPKPLWWWQSPHEATLAPAILHDYLYWEQSCTKDEADAVMYLAMADVGLSGIRAEAIYKGIRTPFAQMAWDGNAAARRNGESRFFTEAYARRLLDSSISPGTTWTALHSRAKTQSGLISPAGPSVANQLACRAAMVAFRAPAAT